MAYTAQEIQSLLEQYGRKANRSLGQNFCTDTELLSSSVKAACVDGMPVIEIGPGMGALTQELLKHASSVTAIEKDSFFYEILPELIPDKRLSLILGDAMKTDYESLFKVQESAIVGNLPYYITTPFVQKVLPMLPKTCLFMVQKEAADRFFAKPKDRIYGPTSILTNVYFEPELLRDVPRSSFWPQPDVESAMVLLRRKENALSLSDPRKFLSFVSSAFAMRRKTLVNNFPKDSGIASCLAECNLDSAVRAEDLNPQIFLSLYTLMSKS